MIDAMTPHFTIRVWGLAGDRHWRAWHYNDWQPHSREPLCEIEIDQTTPNDLHLTIAHHRGLELIPQRMLECR